MKNLTVLTVSYHQKELTSILIRSFEKFKPKDLNITYVVVENSADTTYKDEIEGMALNVKWFNNPEADAASGSVANGLGIEFGKKHIEDEYTFVCHNDVAVTCSSFFEEMFGKIDEGYKLVGVLKDNIRINAVHVSGYLTTTELLKKVDHMADLPRLDVGDRLTEYCRENEIKYHVFRNTHNTPELYEVCNEPFRSLGRDCGVDRCLNKDNKVMFIHLGRGTSKSRGTYWKSGKLSHTDWINFNNGVIL